MERAHLFLFFVLCVSCRASGPDVSTSWHGVNVPRAASPSPEIVTANVVTLEYSDLVQGKDLTAEIERGGHDTGNDLSASAVGNFLY